jgi:hypothetical protein
MGAALCLVITAIEVPGRECGETRPDRPAVRAIVSSLTHSHNGAIGDARGLIAFDRSGRRAVALRSLLSGFPF